MELLKDGRADELRMSADRGDQNVSLVHGRDEPVQRFSTTLTSGRTCTIQNLDHRGETPRRSASFRIVRPAGGGVNLTVQDSTPTLIKALAAGQWCDVMVNDAGVWILAAFGSL